MAGLSYDLDWNGRNYFNKWEGEGGGEVGKWEGVGTIYGIRYFLVPNERQKNKSSLKSNLMKERDNLWRK